jgi:ribonuclease D
MTDRSLGDGGIDGHLQPADTAGGSTLASLVDPEVVLVEVGDQVAPALEGIAEEVVGVDVERADGDRYYRRAALVQVGVEDRCVLLDGVTIDVLPALDRFLHGERLAVLHAVENDLEPLAAKGVHPSRFADTAVAAAMLGLPTGLGALLREVLDVELTDDKETYQRADWAERPLPAGMAAYAAGDVVHLPLLWAALEARLAETGRRGWYDQELTWIVERAAEDTRDWTRVKGSGRLTGAQRAILRAVWEERERLAREHDLAPNRLLHDDVLRDLAVDPPRTEAQLVRRSQRRRNLLRRHAADLFAAVQRGLAAEPEEKGSMGRRWTDRDKATFDALRRTRAEVAEGLGIDAGVLCPSRPLWRAVAAGPSDGRELCEAVELRPWQTELLAAPLWDAYMRTRSSTADAGSDGSEGSEGSDGDGASEGAADSAGAPAASRDQSTSA